MKKKSFSPRSRKPDHVEYFYPVSDTTLFAYMQQVLAPRSRNDIKSLMVHGHVCLNGQPVTYYNTPLTSQDELCINFSRPFPVLTNRMLNILFEDEYLIVVEKKSGLLSVPAGNHRDKTAQTILEEYIHAQDGRSHAYVVHRLDQFTSGILIFAKTPEVQNILRDSWNNYVVERMYIAITENVPAKPEGEIQSYLVENSAMKVYSTPDPEKGKLAVTRYKVLKTQGDYAQVDVQILTGRKNQIRVHLSEMGCPVAGDRKYGAVSNPCGRLMLHNYRLQFIHPITKYNLQFELPLPKCFEMK